MCLEHEELCSSTASKTIFDNLFYYYVSMTLYMKL